MKNKYLYLILPTETNYIQEKEWATEKKSIHSRVLLQLEHNKNFYYVHLKISSLFEIWYQRKYLKWNNNKKTEGLKLLVGRVQEKGGREILIYYWNESQITSRKQ